MGRPTPWQQIPVLINNRNRLEYLRMLIDWLERIGMQRLFVIDNHSSYEPLLDYYETSPHTILRAEENGGHLSIWELPFHREFADDFYIYTDPDVVPAPECPEDVIQVFLEALARYPDVDKVGFGLEIDDIPGDIPQRDEILAAERDALFERRDDVFSDARIDTTFAVYRPAARGGHWLPCLRSGRPYLARHMPWYRGPEQWTPEDVQYAESAEATHWTSKLAEARNAPPGPARS